MIKNHLQKFVQMDRDCQVCHSEEQRDEESYSTDFLLFAWLFVEAGVVRFFASLRMTDLIAFPVLPQPLSLLRRQLLPFCPAGISPHSGESPLAQGSRGALTEAVSGAPLASPV